MLKRLGLIAAVVFAVVVATVARADILDQSVVYQVDGQPYESYFVRNTGFGDSQPIVMLIHDWDGINEYEQRRAQMLAEQGYAAFAVDLYGQDNRPSTTEESQAATQALYADREAMRSRLFTGLEQARKMPGVDPERVVAIGYCFGGAAVLEFARAGADLDGFVSFHGGLTTPEGQDYRQATGPILILHGADDPVAPMSDVAALAEQLNKAGVDYDMKLYGGVAHAFTVWGTNRETSRYDAQADVKSWASLMTFLDKQLR